MQYADDAKRSSVYLEHVPAARLHARAVSERVFLRLRMLQAQAHYDGSLVDGARMLQLATELYIRQYGDEGLFRGVRVDGPAGPTSYQDLYAAESTGSALRALR